MSRLADERTCLCRVELAGSSSPSSMLITAEADLEMESKLVQSCCVMCAYPAGLSSIPPRGSRAAASKPELTCKGRVAGVDAGLHCQRGQAARG
eukprot:scaffold168163_cov32-Tisochrysis_lutea.AAC.5